MLFWGKVVFCFQAKRLHDGFVGAFVHAVFGCNGGVVFEAFEGEFSVFSQSHLGHWWLFSMGSRIVFRHDIAPRISDL